MEVKAASLFLCDLLLPLSQVTECVCARVCVPVFVCACVCLCVICRRKARLWSMNLKSAGCGQKSGWSSCLLPLDLIQEHSPGSRRGHRKHCSIFIYTCIYIYYILVCVHCYLQFFVLQFVLGDFVMQCFDILCHTSFLQ